MGSILGAVEMMEVGLSLCDDVGAMDGVVVIGLFDDGGSVVVMGIPPRLMVGDTVLIPDGEDDGTGITITPDVIVGTAVVSVMGAMTGTLVVMTMGATVSPSSMNKSSL